MTIGICDDVPEFCEMLKESLLSGSYISKDDILLEYHSAKELLEQAPLAELDLLFLDIEMPEMSGIEFLQQHRHLLNKTKIILLTSHLDYALEGYRFHIYRYLEKPAKPDKLRELFEALEHENSLSQTITIHNNERIDVAITLNDILYVEVYNNYSYIATKQQTLKSYTRLKQFRELLPEDFFCQPNKSFIVNMKYITQFDKQARQITMSNNTHIDVSHRNLKEFKKCYTDFWMNPLNQQ